MRRGLRGRPGRDLPALAAAHTAASARSSLARISRASGSTSARPVIPNSAISVATNLTQGFSRVNVDLPVPYETDIEQAIAIIDDLGKALNPPWSLTGVLPERWALAQAEIAAR